MTTPIYWLCRDFSQMKYQLCIGAKTDVRTLPEAHRPFAKILDYSEKAYVLQSRHFRMFIFVTRYVAAITSSSMQYYKPPRKDSKLADLANCIDTYMQKKRVAENLNSAEAISPDISHCWEEIYVSM
ncbi:hypothetical protein QAD02_015127 [Eretmocerus hayati]|uniref:Uncharacterized protein n=1 Tax=Eretmocerus hayati TaxID=131215 RepID=A0ACC2P7F2_9HYME|nr:hypothetical protein QAD02_015127 [Eretmocerus hayati]